MDLDIEMADTAEGISIEEAAQIPEAYTHDIITGEEQEPGEVDEGSTSHANEPQQDEHALILNKVHIRGIDTFNPDDVKTYVASHYSGGQFSKIEWIDDSSANLVYASDSAAHDAFVALAAIEIADATQLVPLQNLPAKAYVSKPDSVLEVRFAVTGDKKVVGASSRSRFYLLNPEFDPEERKRRGEFQRSRYRDRDDGHGRGRRGDRRDGRRREYHYDDEDSAPFDASLYDDAPSKPDRNTSDRPERLRRDSASSGSPDRARQRSYMKQNQGKELFPDRRSRNDRPRGRSVSPGRDRRGEDSMEVDDRARQTASLRNREKARSMKERMLKDNSGKELLPDRIQGTRELFPTNGSSSGSTAQMDRVREETTVLASANLADRVTPRGGGSESSDFSIRGLATKRGPDQGMSIKGKGSTVKELFPERFSNAGKELFADKLEGRGRRRPRAADTFN